MGCVRNRLLALSAAIVVLTAPLQAQQRDTVDLYIAAAMSRQHIPGLSLAVVRAGTVIKAQGYGVADLEHNIPVTPQTVFKIGSVSKPFLATGIMLLAQDGRLSIDAPVAAHYADAPESWKGITLRHFLTHTSGVLREGPAFNALEVQPDSVVVRSAFARPLEFATGSKYQYCNVCYFALADITARVAGKPWDVFLAERVFGPLGMTATRTTTATDLVANRARGYRWRDSGYVNAQEYVALRPSGAFLSSVLDLAKWDAALYDERVLTKASRDAMWTQARLTDGTATRYGFGWQLDSLAGHWRVSHGGSLPGFRAAMARFPNDSLSVIVLANADGANAAMIASDVARIYLAQPPTPAPAQGSPAAAPGRAELIAAAREIMTAARYATLTTNGADGQPNARIVDPFVPDADMTIWFATTTASRKVAEIAGDARVTLLYFDAVAHEYVTVLGTATRINDPAEKLRHWKDEWGEFYADGPRGGDYVLFRVRPARLEIVSPGRGIMNDPKTWRPATVHLQ